MDQRSLCGGYASCGAGAQQTWPVQHAVFYQPRFDAMVEPWVQPGEVPRYRPFSWREYIQGRVTDNFADYGVEHIQISQYALGA